jgi:hypothetical protein
MLRDSSSNKRFYTQEEGEELDGKTVICTMAQAGQCDGKLCHGYHNKPHVYHDADLECFAECAHPGKNGICVEVKV